MLPLTPIGEVTWRNETRVFGRVRSMRVQPWHGMPTLELTIFDDTGGITVVFTGRRAVPGIELGANLEVTGRAGSHNGRLSLLNPIYRLTAPTKTGH